MKKFYFMITMKLICNQLAFLKTTNEIIINPNDLMLFILAEKRQTMKKKTLNCIRKIKQKPKKIFQEYKIEIRKPIQKTDLINFFLGFYFFYVLCLFVVVMAFAIDKEIKAYALKKNITYNQDGTNFWNINTKSLEKKDRPLILQHKYLIAEQERTGLNKKFFLLKDTGKKIGAEREYSEEKSDLFEFLFNDNNFDILYIRCSLLYYSAHVGVEFYKESGEKCGEYYIIPIDWPKIEQESQDVLFSYREDCFLYKNQKITKINIQDIKTKIKVTPQLTEYAFKKMNSYFWYLFWHKQGKIANEKEKKKQHKKEKK